MREHASERERLAITADYYLDVTGELEKAAQTYRDWIESYPRDDIAQRRLGNVYNGLGQYEKASDAYREGVRFAPDSVGSYEGLANSLLALQRFDEVQKIIEQPRAREGWMTS